MGQSVPVGPLVPGSRILENESEHGVFDHGSVARRLLRPEHVPPEEHVEAAAMLDAVERKRRKYLVDINGGWRIVVVAEDAGGVSTREDSFQDLQGAFVEVENFGVWKRLSFPHTEDSHRL